MSPPLLTTIMSIAATMLALAALVQIVQEVYKYLTSSKERAYTNTLFDFVGPWAVQLLRPGRLLNLQVRGPLQLIRFKPRRLLLPLDKDDLASALEATAPFWVKRTLERLKIETELQKGTAQTPSRSWLAFLEELRQQEKGSAGYREAKEIEAFLQQWSDQVTAAVAGSSQHPETMDAAKVMVAFRREFLAHVVNVTDHFRSLEQNFEYAYRRRNLRQTFTIALIIALAFNLSIQKIHTRAIALTPEEAVALAEKSIQLYEKQKEISATLSEESTEDAQKIKSLRESLDEARSLLSQGNVLDVKLLDLKEFRDEAQKAWLWSKIILYLSGCGLTALLVSFGAPFWNDLLSALFRIQRPRSGGKGTSEGTTGG